jgi:hypothetical protein
VTVGSPAATRGLRWLAVLGLAIVLMGCVPATSAPTSSASGSLLPSALAVPETSVCRDVDLQLPNGDPLDLTGTWLGDDAAYWMVAQVGDCVWGTASDEYTFPPLSNVYWQIYLRGTLLPDFTIPIEYAYSPFSVGRGSVAQYGHAVLSIEFGTGDSPLTLRKTDGTTCNENNVCPFGMATLQTTTWTLVSSRILLPPPTPEP